MKSETIKDIIISIKMKCIAEIESWTIEQRQNQAKENILYIKNF